MNLQKNCVWNLCWWSMWLERFDVYIWWIGNNMNIPNKL
jgi:hypothetical protein